MILAEPCLPLRLERRQPSRIRRRTRARPHGAAIVEADGLHPGEAVQRPRRQTVESCPPEKRTRAVSEVRVIDLIELSWPGLSRLPAETDSAPP